MSTEPKTVDGTIDEFLAKRNESNASETTDTATEPAQAETTETDDTGASGNVPAKTSNAPESAEDFTNMPKGFANHPAWMKREAKLKEAEEKLKRFEADNSSYSKLLDDPAVYKKYLMAKGYSEEAIKTHFREKGIQDEAPKAGNLPAKGELDEAICAKLGWDINRLNADQRVYLKDQVRLTEALLEEKMGAFERKLDERIKPYEDMRLANEQSKKLNSDFRQVAQMAQEEFSAEYAKDPAYFKKVIEPAMDKILDDYDAKHLPYPDAVSLYEKATRQLLRENLSARGRQEVRDEKKLNARPLVPGSNPTNGAGIPKGQSVSETIDKFMAARGQRG